MLSCSITLPLLTKITPVMHNKLTVCSNHYKNMEKEKQNNGQDKLPFRWPPVYQLEIIYIT